MKTDVIIVGSGIIGMSLALSLSLKKKKVVIIEKNFSNALKINRVYSISEKTKNFFNDIEIWQDIASSEIQSFFLNKKFIYLFFLFFSFFLT